MLKYQPRKQEKNEVSDVNAWANRLACEQAEGSPHKEVRFMGHTGYCQEYAIDLLMGKIFAEYTTSIAPGSQWPIETLLAQKHFSKPIDIAPTMPIENAIRLFSNWGDDEYFSNQDEWNSLKRSLEEDRLSNRRLFNE